MEINYLENYYNNYEENTRLQSRHGQIEFITSMKYIEQYLEKGAKILDVGAGTGRYSLALSRKGYNVTAVELVQHNIDVFKSLLKEDDNISINQGNAMDLSVYPDASFDAVLIFGPMYHLYSKEEKTTVLNEAKRIIRDDGYIFAAYCMNEPTIIQWGFGNDGINVIDALKNNMFKEGFKCISEPKDIFELVRVEDIEELNKICGLYRVKLIGTDMFAHYIKDRIDSWNHEVYKIYLEYHFSICERADIIGLSNHTMDILKKRK